MHLNYIAKLKRNKYIQGTPIMVNVDVLLQAITSEMQRSSSDKEGESTIPIYTGT